MFGNNFGLGLVLTFTDNATSGINSVVNSLNQLTQVAENASSQFNQMASLGAFSTIATSVGNSFTSMGMKTINTLGDIIGKVNETGQTLMFADSQLSKLYEGSGRTGQDVLADIQDYAKKTIFEFKDLIPAVTMLKANGIEAFESIASSTGKSDQMLMDYAADLAAFNPFMRNQYGTGIKAAMGALNEYIAEGNALSLKRGASLDIEAILGEKKGADIEERSRQVADLMEKLNMVGMTASMAETPMVKISNLGDVLFQFVGKIANSGVYDAFNEIIDVISKFVMAIDDAELDNIAKVIADSLASLLTPVKKAAEYLVKVATAFKDLIQENPMIAKFIIQGTALAGVFLVISGIALKVAGAIGFLTLGLNKFGESFSILTKTLTGGMRSILATLLPLTLAVAGLTYIWKNDIGGVQTTVTDFIDNLVDSFHRADEMVNLDVVSMHEAIKSLDRSDFFDNLTYGLMQLKVLFKGVAEAWDDYTLSEDTFEKARELGILPLIEAILDFKYRFDAFKAGFKKGFSEVIEHIMGALKKLTDTFEGTFIGDLLHTFTEFLHSITEGDADKWEQFGETIGKLVPKMILLGGALKVLSTLATPLSAVISVLGKLKTLDLGSALSGLGSMFSNIEVSASTFATSATNIVKSFGSALKNAFAITPLGAIVTTALASIFAYATTNPDSFMSDLTTLKDNIVESFSNLAEEVAPFFEPIKEALGNLKESIEGFIESAKNNEGIQSFIEKLSLIGEVLMSVLVPLVSGAVDLITTTLGKGISFISELLGGVIDIISGIINIISGILSGDTDKLVSGCEQVFTGIINIITANLNLIIGVVTSILNTLLGIIKGLLKSGADVLKNAFTHILDNIHDNLNNALDFVKGIVTKILEFLGFDGAAEKVGNAFDKVKEKISTIFDSIKNIVSNAVEKLKKALDFDWKLPDLKLPHINVTGGEAPFGLGGKGSLPKFDIKWYAEGGVFDKPNVIGVGEAGTEAVMPLENNTGWIDVLANQLVTKLQGLSIEATAPKDNSLVPIANKNSNLYDTSSNTPSIESSGGGSTTYDSHNTSQNVTFAEGSIQLNVQNASPQEAEKLAKYIMNYIKRQTELQDMANYA